MVLDAFVSFCASFAGGALGAYLIARAYLARFEVRQRSIARLMKDAGRTTLPREGASGTAVQSPIRITRSGSKRES